MNYFVISPLILQGLAMFFDEFYYHHKRGLPKWERLGHPADTLTVLATLSIPLFYENSRESLLVYAGLALFSCLFVTKDEFVHTKECAAGEHWLHSLLFILHPLVFTSLGVIWIFPETFQSFQFLIKGQFVFVVLFLVYQILYWNVWRSHGKNGKTS